MKKVKIMLMAILVLAIAGGTLAFKAKFGDTQICTIEAIEVNDTFTCTDELNTEGLVCPDDAFVTLQGLNLETVCYTTTDAAVGCQTATCFETIAVSIE